MYLLLAENNYISSREIKALLAKNGLDCEVLKCSSSDALLDVAEKLLPDIIIIDFDLSLNHSEKIIREIRRLSPKAYILAFVSSVHFEKIAGAIETGIDDYMIKPLRREDVMMRLLLGLQRKAAQSEKPAYPAEDGKREKRDSWESAFNREPAEKKGEKKFIFYNCNENSSGKKKTERDGELINFVDLLKKTEIEESIAPVEEEQVDEESGEEKDASVFITDNREDLKEREDIEGRDDIEDKIEEVKDEEKDFFNDLNPDTGDNNIPWPDEERAYFGGEEENIDSGPKSIDYSLDEQQNGEDEESLEQDWLKEPDFSSFVSDENCENAAEEDYLQVETPPEDEEPGCEEERQEEANGYFPGKMTAEQAGETEQTDEMTGLMELAGEPEQPAVPGGPAEGITAGQETEEEMVVTEVKQGVEKIDDSELFGVRRDEAQPDTTEFEELFGESNQGNGYTEKENYTEDLFNDELALNMKDEKQSDKAAAEKQPVDQRKGKIIGSIVTASVLVMLLTISVLFL